MDLHERLFLTVKSLLCPQFLRVGVKVRADLEERAQSGFCPCCNIWHHTDIVSFTSQLTMHFTS